MQLPRPVAAALVLAATVVLGGCVLVPAWAPVADVPPRGPQPAAVLTDPDDALEDVVVAVESAEPGDGGEHTVDDGAGDAWTYAVDAIEAPAELASDDVPEGMVAVAVVLDAAHLHGISAFGEVFEVLVVLDDGTVWTSLSDESQALVGVDDAAARTDDFAGGRIVVAVAAGAIVEQVVVDSVFGDDQRSFTP
ncbi:MULTISPECIES: hypothetical protein [unclassified Agrococcus]|uniref:hypothetical protein n=1 Tax=unclassified Agrococcus TaxID=2615065 RepID=UPI003612EF8B